jgi:hypothetical protein
MNVIFNSGRLVVVWRLDSEHAAIPSGYGAVQMPGTAAATRYPGSTPRQRAQAQLQPQTLTVIAPLAQTARPRLAAKLQAQA